MAQESERSTGNERSHGTPRSASGVPPDDWTQLYDSNLRFAIELINKARWDQLAARTGIECFVEEPQFLSLFLELNRDRLVNAETRKFDIELLQGLELLVPSSYANEFDINPALRTIAVRLELDPQADLRTKKKGRLVEDALKDIATSGLVSRVRIAVPHGQCLQRSLAVLDLPPGGVYHTHRLTGKDIVIGIIDDGCAFADPDFLTIVRSGGVDSYHTRVLRLWDQSQEMTSADKLAGWTETAGMGYGRELTDAVIDGVLPSPAAPTRIDEDAVYKQLRYDKFLAAELATHGTKVMGIAAGNGTSTMGSPGVATGADIIFVQLPPYLVRHAPKLLSDKIVHGVHYIFQRAAELGKKAAVINISYGGNSGAHDGTSGWESAIDDLLAVDNRAVVVSAGNGFESDCHAMGRIKPHREKKLSWMLRPFDTTGNDLEIWYNGDATLEIELVAPNGQIFGPFPFGPRQELKRGSDGALIGYLEHVHADPANGDNSITIALGATAEDVPPLATAFKLALAGTWHVRLDNVGTRAARFNAWIARDDLDKGGIHQQSRFPEEQSNPKHTICDMATGKLTISVGAFNAATNEVCAYSACGPTRPSTKDPSPRQKPEICAPAEELALGGGVLTTASRQGAPRRMNGTSAAAPHVTGIGALALDHRRNHQGKNLSADELLDALSPQIGEAPLIPNRRAANHPRRIKQADVWKDLIGAGKVSCTRTLDNVDKT
jgi:subtilisin family serine protease